MNLKSLAKNSYVIKYKSLFRKSLKIILSCKLLQISLVQLISNLNFFKQTFVLYDVTIFS